MKRLIKNNSFNKMIKNCHHTDFDKAVVIINDKPYIGQTHNDCMDEFLLKGKEVNKMAMGCIVNNDIYIDPAGLFGYTTNDITLLAPSIKQSLQYIKDIYLDDTSVPGDHNKYEKIAKNI
jgi:hypothetical protein